MWVRRGAKALMCLAGVLALLGAACSKSSSPPSGGSPSAAGGITLQQGSGGLVFTPSTLTVKQGDVLAVANVGSASHTFTITGKGIDVVNQPGQTQNVTISLAPGTYPFICRFHESLGMKGTLTVTG
jgi:plastocyanin